LRPAYRARQFVAALAARVTDADVAEAEAHLPPGARLLFRRMPRDAQAHGLRVLRDLKHAGETHPSLLAAALLHDAGKLAARIGPVSRSVIVVLKRFAPRLLDRLSAGSPVGWRTPFVVQRDHPRIGAEWARQAGCDALTVSLIARHQDHLDGPALSEEDRLLKALQEADDRN
jgi:hypothetical protein